MAASCSSLGSRLGVVSAFEELHQHGSKSFRGNIMRVPFQGTALCVGEGERHRLRRALHERGTCSTVYDKRGYREGCQPFCGDRAIPHDGIIVSKRRCHRLEEWPDGRLAHTGNRFRRRAPRGHGESGGITPASLAEQSRQLSRIILRRLAGMLVTRVERWLVQRQLRDGKATLRGLKGENPA